MDFELKHKVLKGVYLMYVYLMHVCKPNFCKMFFALLSQWASLNSCDIVVLYSNLCYKQ